MRPQNSTVEAVLAWFGTRAHGVVKRRQLIAAGVSASGIQRRLRKGTLLREYPGVYRVGHRAPSIEAWNLAAVWACGEGALLCGRAAAYLHGLIQGAPPEPEVVMLTWRRIRGIRTRRARKMHPSDAAVVRGIPVTTVAATIVALAADSSPDELARVCHEAGVRYRTTPAQVEKVLARRPNSPGAGKLRAVLRGEVKVALSVVERTFHGRLRDAGLPLPEANERVGGRRLDCHWPGLTVELDSYRYHNSRHAWELDRRREREAFGRQEQIRRYTHDDVMKHPQLMLKELTGILGRRAA